MGAEAMEFGRVATAAAVSQNINLKFGVAAPLVKAKVFILFTLLGFADVFLVGLGYHTYIMGRTSLGFVCAEPANIQLSQNATSYDGFKSNSDDGCPLLHNTEGLEDSILCPPEGCKIHVGTSASNQDTLSSIQKASRGILITSAVLEFVLLLISSPFSQPVIVSQVISAVLAILLVVFEFFRDSSDYSSDIAVATLWLRVIRVFFTLSAVVFLYVELFLFGAVRFLQRVRELFKDKDFGQNGRLPATDLYTLMKDLVPEGYSEPSLRKASAQMLTKLDPRRTEYVSYSSCMAGCIDLVIPAIDEDELEAIMGSSLNQPLLGGGGKPWTREEDNELRALRSKKDKGITLTPAEEEKYQTLSVGYERFNEKGARLMGSPSISPPHEVKIDAAFGTQSPSKSPAQMSTYSDFLRHEQKSLNYSPPSSPPPPQPPSPPPHNGPPSEASPQLTTYSGFLGNPLQGGSPQISHSAFTREEEALTKSDVWQLKVCDCGAKFRVRGNESPECPSCMGKESIKKKSATKLQICNMCGLRYKSNTNDNSDCPICASPTAEEAVSTTTFLKTCDTCGLKYRSGSKSTESKNECPGCGFVTVRSPTSPDALRSIPDCVRTTTPTSPSTQTVSFTCKGCGHGQTRSVPSRTQVVTCKSCFMTCNLNDTHTSKKSILDDSPRKMSPSPSLKWVSPTSSYNYKPTNKHIPESLTTPGLSEDTNDDWCLITCKGCGDPLKYRSDPNATEDRIIRCPGCSATRLVSPSKQVAFESDSWVLFKCRGCLSLMKKKGSQAQARCSNCGQLETSSPRRDGAASPLYMPPIDENAL